MKKYYTRACNFYYGEIAKALIRKKKALPLCGNNLIAFDQLEIFIRRNNKIKSKFILLKNIKNLKRSERKAINHDLKKIISKRKNF